MTKLLYVLAACILLLALFSGCSQDRNPLPSKSHAEDWEHSQIEGHGVKVLSTGQASCLTCHGNKLTGGTSKISCYHCHSAYPHKVADDNSWMTPSNANFHGTFLRNRDFNVDSCIVCHGADFNGIPSKGTSACSTCHSYPHPDGWMNAQAANFHGENLRHASWSTAACQSCHGNDLKGDDKVPSCYKCHSDYPHSSDWANPLSPGYHGAVLKQNNWATASCQACHGADFTGGSSGVSCKSCHESYPHTSGWTGTTTGSHLEYIKSGHWSLTECKACHGQDYKGGSSDASCYICHTSAQGPEDCSLCHGSSNNIAPPKDLQGNIQVTAMGVGRHQRHLEIFGVQPACELCHIVPKNFSDAGHIDDTPYAEVNAIWQWDRTSATCVTGCHENNTSLNYVWNHP